MVHRVNVGEIYYTLDAYGEIMSRVEENSSLDNWLFQNGNYFNIKSQAFYLQSELITKLCYVW